MDHEVARGRKSGKLKPISGVIGISLALILSGCGGSSPAAAPAQSSVATNALTPVACQIIVGHIIEVANALKGYGVTVTADDAAKVFASARDSWSNEAAAATPETAKWLNSMSDSVARMRVAFLDPTAPNPQAAEDALTASISQFKTYCS